MNLEQRIRLVIRHTGVEGDPDLGGTFAFLLRICQTRANLGRWTEKALTDQLCSAYMRFIRPDTIAEEVLGTDALNAIRYAVAGHLCYAQRYLQEFEMIERDDDSEAE